MELFNEKILLKIIKKSSFVLVLSLILFFSIVGFLYWKYLYLAINFEPEVTLESQIEKKVLQKIEEYINTREKGYLEGLKRSFSDPFW